MRLVGLVATCVGALVAVATSLTTPLSQFHLAGDYILGGLFSLHAEVVGKPHLSYSEVPLCKKYKPKVVGYSYLQAMRFAVEEINNSSVLLPGVSLGYEMEDVCYLTNMILPVLYFLSDNRSQIEIRTNWTGYRPRVVAVIGPDSSPASVSTAYILSQFLVPQITYSASTEALSNPRLFPVAFRTIPSTEQQVAVMLLLLRWFRWDWVIVLSSDDNYGQQNLQLLRSQASWACIAFQEIIPVQQGQQGSNDTETWIRDVVGKIQRSTAQVVLVLSLELPLLGFFQEVLRQNVSGLVWIGAEAWASDPSVHSITNLSSVGTIFGVAVQNVPIPGLNDFRVRVPTGPAGAAAAQALGETCNQDCDGCLASARANDRSLRGTGHRIDFNVYSAVYVVAHALHRLLRCGRSGCRKQPVHPWQVSAICMETTVPVARHKEAAPVLGAGPELWGCHPLSPLSWLCSFPVGVGAFCKGVRASACLFVPQLLEEVGRVNFTLLNTPINFNEKGDPPQWLRDNYTCQRCPPDMWSLPGQEECFMRRVVYLHWKEPISIVLLLCNVVGLLASLGTLATFVRHANSPVVKSAGGSLCLLMLASLLAGFCSIPFYIGQPTELTCVCRQTIFSLCFSVCISCITVRSFQIIFVFKVAGRLPGAYNVWMKYHGQQVFVAAVSVAKVLLVAINIGSHLPAPVEYLVGTDPAELILICNRSYRSSMVMNNVFDMSLSFLCFCCAYMGRALPKNYNEAKYITLCMTSYFTTWVGLILVMSVFEGMVVTIFDAAAVLSNLFGILLGYFGSKCYVIFFHPERNTAAFFQTAIQSYTMRQE
ncbi:hypothetical protein lerEdw1_003139 [Lerista edwardsae]|nr:hypothetical protein lerEdw1_003139 [Lerista edwardsae]